MNARYYVDEGGSVRDSALETSATKCDSELDECVIVDRLNGVEALRDEIRSLSIELKDLRQKVADAEWFRDKHAEAIHINFADPPDQHWLWQVYDCDGDLIGDAMVNDYWQAIRAAREGRDG